MKASEVNITLCVDVERMKYFIQSRCILRGNVDGDILEVYVTNGIERLYDKPTYLLTIDIVNGPTIITVK